MRRNDRVRPLNRTQTLLAFLALLATLLVPGMSSAAGCAVTTSASSAAAPHVRDPQADAAIANPAVAPPAHADALDVRSLWLRATPAGAVTANIGVTSLATHPAGTVYYVEFSGQPWLSARALPDGTWTFSSGLSSWTTPAAGVREETKAIAGSVTGNTITLAVPASYVPNRPAGGGAVKISAPLVRTAYSASAPVAAPAASGVYVNADTGDNATYCDVLLYG